MVKSLVSVEEEKQEVRIRPHAIYEFSPSMTKQSFMDEVNINKIIERALQGQDIMNTMRDKIASYGDFSDVPSYQEALNLVRRANDAFMCLDVHVRERFDNDPGKMIEFVQNDENYDEAVKLGLITPKTPVASDVTEDGAKASSDAATSKAKPK